MMKKISFFISLQIDYFQENEDYSQSDLRIYVREVLNQLSEFNTLRTKNDDIFLIISQIEVTRVPL